MVVNTSAYNVVIFQIVGGCHLILGMCLKQSSQAAISEGISSGVWERPTLCHLGASE